MELVIAPEPILVIEVSWETRNEWAVDEWTCGRDVDCCFVRPRPLGWMLDDDDAGHCVAPYIVIYEDGEALMVCEDCAAEAQGVINDRNNYEGEYE